MLPKVKIYNIFNTLLNKDNLHFVEKTVNL